MAIIRNYFFGNDKAYDLNMTLMNVNVCLDLVMDEVVERRLICINRLLHDMMYEAHMPEFLPDMADGILTYCDIWFNLWGVLAPVIELDQDMALSDLDITSLSDFDGEEPITAEMEEMLCAESTFDRGMVDNDIELMHETDFEDVNN